MCSYDVKLFEDDVGLGTDELRLAKSSMTAASTGGNVGEKCYEFWFSSTLKFSFRYLEIYSIAQVSL